MKRADQAALKAEIAARKDATLSTTEAARVLGIDVKTIQKAIREGKLPASLPFRATDPTRVGRRGYRITPEDLQQWYFGD